MDIATVGSLLGSLKTATEIAKVFKDSGLTLEKAEAKLKLAELVSALADAKLEAAEIQQAIIDRDERIRNLEAEAKVRTQLRWQEPCYFLPNPQGVDEPFCQHCYDANQKLARLHSDGRGQYHCKVCEKVFTTRERVNSDTAAIRQRNPGGSAMSA